MAVRQSERDKYMAEFKKQWYNDNQITEMMIWYDEQKAIEEMWEEQKIEDARKKEIEIEKEKINIRNQNLRMQEKEDKTKRDKLIWKIKFYVKLILFIISLIWSLIWYFSSDTVEIKHDRNNRQYLTSAIGNMPLDDTLEPDVVDIVDNWISELNKQLYELRGENMKVSKQIDELTEYKLEVIRKIERIKEELKSKLNL